MYPTHMCSFLITKRSWFYTGVGHCRDVLIFNSTSFKSLQALKLCLHKGCEILIQLQFILLHPFPIFCIPFYLWPLWYLLMRSLKLWLTLWTLGTWMGSVELWLSSTKACNCITVQIYFLLLKCTLWDMLLNGGSLVATDGFCCLQKPAVSLWLTYLETTCTF